MIIWINGSFGVGKTTIAKKLENKINNTESAIDEIHTKFGNGESLFNEMISEGYLRVHSADKPNMKSNETNIGKDGTK